MTNGTIFFVCSAVWVSRCSFCGHFSDFLSDPTGKQSAISKRGQEGSPMAKPKPMVPVKARPVHLVLRSPWSASENPPQDSGYPDNLVNVDEGQGSQTCTDHPKPRNRMFSIEARKFKACSKTRRNLYWSILRTFPVCQYRNSVSQSRRFVPSHVLCTVASVHQ